jgi:predicted GNAT family N-acyltransferase
MGNERAGISALKSVVGRFEPAFYRWLDHAAPRPIDIASRDDLATVLAAARDSMTLAADPAVDAIRARDPEQFLHIADPDGGPGQLLAYLALNASGAAALVDGRFNGLRPDPAWIAMPGEPAEAIYIWLVWAPRQMGQGLRLIAEMERTRGRGLPIFSRAVTAVSARAQNAIGFEAASSLYPSAPDWLLVTLPRADDRRPDIAVVIARTMEDIARVFAIRSAVYMAEQFPLYSEEFDGNDFCATQMLALVNGDPAGCMRIRWFGDFAKIERVAVRKEYRRHHLGPRLVRAGVEHCRRKGFRKLYAHSRADLVPLWRTLGWREMEGPPFHFADVSYREIMLDVEPAEDAIRFGSDPMMLLRPEGAWDELGPFDRTQLGGDRGRRHLIDRFAGLRRTAQHPGRP